ncbi:threonine--tRNA ligase [Buchnera aphidicola (Thelaxes californica)]|uniref:Threonine--tRNA ligase n=1 Tax=Buchnera aphidicola (Thelaxes californica) TaxID=1315998 RepID=A0A4D6YF20_9GAMM|nr:threonine--tRNA ligase [Buchnera aphidicola]QCI26653.1 threonine--tRNA ligase [Buchnera aphidicola (Thelaxes californica)]
MPVITFLDGTKCTYEENVSFIQVLKDYKPDLISSCVGGLVNHDTVIHINTILNHDVCISVICNKDVYAMNLIRVTCGHLLGYAVKQLWPDIQLVQFTLTKNGFFYDFDTQKNFSKIELQTIENKMKELSLLKYDIKFKMFSIQDAKKYFFDQPYKINIIQNSIKEDNKNITVYFHNDHPDIFLNLTQASNISFCTYFKVEKCSGIYWNKDKKQKVLQRIYVISWPNSELYNSYFSQISSLKKRDHRILAKKLDLYHMQDDVPGMVFWHSKGWSIFKELQNFIRLKLTDNEYEEVKTPIIINKKMWEKSGHWENYNTSMFTTFSEKKEYCIKPMSCPAHIQIFNHGLKSYKDLPIRMSEFGHCHRNEYSGSLHGLLRVREFTQDDGHIFCSKNQIRKEIEKCIIMILDIYRIFGFKKIDIKLATRPIKRIGDEQTWDQAEQDLLFVLKKNKLSFELKSGEGAFYGPKIELVLEDSLRRSWQCGTIQLDFYLPKLLNAVYINKDNKKENPILIHRAILGSIERFIGILIEEYNGIFPVWLAPIQVILISVAEEYYLYIHEIKKQLICVGIRTVIDTRAVSMKFKIREHVLAKVPYILVCGKKERLENKISIRTNTGIKINLLELKKFISHVTLEINTRSNINWEV